MLLAAAGHSVGEFVHFTSPLVRDTPALWVKKSTESEVVEYLAHDSSLGLAPLVLCPHELAFLPAAFAIA
jgi:hypothetical protein